MGSKTIIGLHVVILIVSLYLVQHGWHNMSLLCDQIIDVHVEKEYGYYL